MHNMSHVLQIIYELIKIPHAEVSEDINVPPTFLFCSLLSMSFLKTSLCGRKHASYSLNVNVGSVFQTMLRRNLVNIWLLLVAVGSGKGLAG